jgi:excisionase family DNA binding protein
MDYKTMKEVADELGVTRMTVYNWARRLELPIYVDTIDRRMRLFPQEQVEALREVVNRRRRVPQLVK